MIRKIQSNEYLKRYGNMTAAERQSYQDRVGQWLRSEGRMLKSRTGDYDARLKDVVTLSVGWNDVECMAFEEGARLLSALITVSDTWLPELLYVKSARRVVKKMAECLSYILQKPLTKEEPAEETRKGTQVVDNGSKNAAAQPSHTRNERKDGEPTLTLPKGVSERNEVTGVPVRPKHIDQYVHLLPRKTQERASQVRGLLRDLDVARENARRLMESGVHPDVIAPWSKKATLLDESVNSIYKELDAEWNKLVADGRVTVDAFGNAHIPSEECSVKSKESATADSNTRELSPEDKKKLTSIRCFLRDTRKGAGEKREEHIEKWKQKYRELIELGGKESVTASICAAAEHYGIDFSNIATTN